VVGLSNEVGSTQTGPLERLEELCTRATGIIDDAWRSYRHDPMLEDPPDPGVDSARYVVLRAEALELVLQILGDDGPYVETLRSNRLTMARVSSVEILIGILRAVKKDLPQGLQPHPVVPDLSVLHPDVVAASGELYRDGHYRQALLDATIALVERVKERANRHDLDGTPLMQQVFSPKRPVLRLSPNEDEQLGWMWLFSGAVMAIRNPKAHSLRAQPDAQTAFEWLAFCSALFRLLDGWFVIDRHQAG